MNTSVGSKKQQKKKASAKKGLRNVLAQPCEKYWPILGDDEDNSLEAMLNRLLPGLKRKSQAIPWAQLRKMEKAERLVAQKKRRMETQERINGNSLLKVITMGVNAVTRQLEQNSISSVLLDSCVESLLVKHVVEMAQNKGIPILLVPFLKKVSLETIGFASAAMGFKHDVTESGHPFHEIHRQIVKCSPPVASARDCMSNESTKIPIQNLPEDVEMTIKSKDLSPETRLTVSPNVYKYRSTLKERAFVPPNAVEKVANDKGWSDFIAIGTEDVEMEIEKVLIPRKKPRYMKIGAKDENSAAGGPASGDYIGFGSTIDESSVQPPAKHVVTKNTTYLPLIVKRIQGNTNRLKATRTPKQKKKSLTNKG